MILRRTDMVIGLFRSVSPRTKSCGTSMYTCHRSSMERVIRDVKHIIQPLQVPFRSIPGGASFSRTPPPPSYHGSVTFLFPLRF